MYKKSNLRIHSADSTRKTQKVIIREGLSYVVGHVYSSGISNKILSYHDIGNIEIVASLKFFIKSG